MYLVNDLFKQRLEAYKKDAGEQWALISTMPKHNYERIIRRIRHKAIKQAKNLLKAGMIVEYTEPSLFGLVEKKGEILTIAGDYVIIRSSPEHTEGTHITNILNKLT